MVKNLTQSGEPQRYSWGTQKKKKRQTRTSGQTRVGGRRKGRGREGGRAAPMKLMLSRIITTYQQQIACPCQLVRNWRLRCSH